MQKISPIKQRISQYVDHQRLSRREFYAKTGISRGTLENPSGITEDTLVKFLAIYPNISPYWLLFGTGPMEILREDKFIQVNEPHIVYGKCKECELRENLIKEKSEIISLLKEKIALISREINGNPRDIRQTGS